MGAKISMQIYINVYYAYKMNRGLHNIDVGITNN